MRARCERAGLLLGVQLGLPGGRRDDHESERSPAGAWGLCLSFVADGREPAMPVLWGYVFREVQSGGSSSCGITPDGQTMCWGRGFEGELGNGTTSERSLRPVRVIDPSPERGSR